jgi:hypothetical protein
MIKLMKNKFSITDKIYLLNFDWISMTIHFVNPKKGKRSEYILQSTYALVTIIKLCVSKHIQFLFWKS